MAFSNARDGQNKNDGRYSKSEYKPRKKFSGDRENQNNNQGRSGDGQKKSFNGKKEFRKPFRDDRKDGFRGNKNTGANNDKETKVKEQQPDKFEIINRLEREKKVIKKKQDNTNRKAKGQNTRPQAKMKRSGNIDWNKEYENDSYDNDDSYFDY